MTYHRVYKSCGNSVYLVLHRWSFLLSDALECSQYIHESLMLRGSSKNVLSLTVCTVNEILWGWKINGSFASGSEVWHFENEWNMKGSLASGVQKQQESRFSVLHRDGFIVGCDIPWLLPWFSIFVATWLGTQRNSSNTLGD